jgi:hypothetical protein
MTLRSFSFLRPLDFQDRIYRAVPASYLAFAFATHFYSISKCIG